MIMEFKPSFLDSKVSGPSGFLQYLDPGSLPGPGQRDGKAEVRKSRGATAHVERRLKASQATSFTHTYTYTHIYIYIYLHIYVDIHIYVDRHIFADIHMYVDIHIYVDIQKRPQMQRLCKCKDIHVVCHRSTRATPNIEGPRTRVEVTCNLTLIRVQVPKYNVSAQTIITIPNVET